MENKVSEKIRLVLNELAILNQPEHKNDKIFFRLEDLRRMRSLGAELYFLADTASRQGEILFAEENTQPVAPLPPIEPVFEPVAPEPEIQPEPEPQVVVEEMSAVEEVVVSLDEPTEIQEVAEEVVTEEEITKHEPTEELQEGHHHEAPKYTAAHISAQLSLTRRFEYINNLFGGNTEQFMEFLDELGYCKTADEAMAIFDRYAANGNWRRRQESADDFRRSLRKLF
jgi:hypothetical protein